MVSFLLKSDKLFDRAKNDLKFELGQKPWYTYPMDSSKLSCGKIADFKLIHSKRYGHIVAETFSKKSKSSSGQNKLSICDEVKILKYVSNEFRKRTSDWSYEALIQSWPKIWLLFEQKVCLFVKTKTRFVIKNTLNPETRVQWIRLIFLVLNFWPSTNTISTPNWTFLE